MLSTPVLLIVFNRPEIAQKAFDQIRKVKPQYLFVAADGPRPNRPDDINKCADTREILTQIDWQCELKTLFREQNRGCGHGPAEAITWFFDQVEQGIILEDDCLADPSFFYFCQELLEKYKYDERISMIAGTNPLINWKRTKGSYVFSNMGFSWGWASWQRAWKEFDYNAAKWKTKEGQEKVKAHLNNDYYFDHYKREFDFYFSKVRDDVWDFQWLFCRLHQESYTILPVVNLVTNVGFNEESTHTFDPGINIAHLTLGNLHFPLKHPAFQVSTFVDWYIFERFINPQKRSISKRVVLKLLKTFL